MKNRLGTFFVACALLIGVFSACKYEKHEREEDYTGEYKIDLSGLQSNGTSEYICDGTYLISPYLSEESGNGFLKRNVKTGRLTSLCITPGCDHSGTFAGSKPDFACVPNDSDIFFIGDQKVFYNYTKQVFNEAQLKMERSEVFSSYDMTTGEYRALDTTEHMGKDIYISNRIYHDGYAYFCNRKASTEGASSDEYEYTLCRMSLSDSKIEELSALGKQKANLFAVNEDKAYFVTELGGLFEVSIVESKRRELIADKSELKLAHPFDQLNDFYLDGYIYFRSAAEDYNEHYLYRINCESGEIEKLTNDLVTWMCITEYGICYGVSGASDDVQVHRIKRIKLDGELLDIFDIEMNEMEIDDACGVGGQVYLYGTRFYSVDYINKDGDPGTITAQWKYSIVWDVLSGEFEYIYKYENVPTIPDGATPRDPGIGKTD